MSTNEFDFDEFVAYGSILVQPGSLPFALFHGESLVACAAWALDGAQVQVADASVTWEGLLDHDEDESLVLVLHDALCPGVEPSFIAECVDAARQTGALVAAALPVTDTVKTLSDGMVSGTVDREDLVQVTSPVVLDEPAIRAAAVLWPGGLGDLPDDTAEIVSRLAGRTDVQFVPAPAGTARIGSKDELAALEAATRPMR